MKIDLAGGTVKCNCSICTKQRNWLAAVGPEAFRLRAGEADLTEYRFGGERIQHLFCRHCGVRSFSRAESDGKRVYAVNVNCLDDVPAEELARAPVTYVDGRHDDWRSAPAEIRHL